MYRVAVDQLPPGAILGASLFDRHGRLLAQAGVALRDIRRRQIQEHGYRRVLITDGAPPQPEAIPSAVRAGLFTALHRAVTFLRPAWQHASGADAAGDDTPWDAAAPPRGEKDRRTAWILDLALRHAVDDLVQYSAGGRGLSAPGPLRSAPLQWFDDAIDAAITALVIGNACRLDSPTLRRLAHGMILRDIGMLALPVDLREADGPLSPEQTTLIREHPERAYQLLRHLDWGDETARLIVRQHHERHDGSGYPDGLAGVGSVRRTRSERLDTSITLLVSDIAAVADVFNALLADRNHRAPRSPGVVTQMLHAMAGNKLSATVVETLLQHWTPVPEAEPAGLRPSG